MSEPSMDDEHVILPRPYISAFINKEGDVTIRVIAVSSNHEHVEDDMVVIPLECVVELGEALQRIGRR